MVHDVTPPTLSELIRDNPVFKQFMKTRPSIPTHLKHGSPWMLWAKTSRNTWVNPMFPNYDSAWASAVNMIRRPDEYTDVSVISRRVLFPPPRVLMPWLDELLIDRFEWCGRCRRPSSFRLSTSRHHAVRKYPVTTDDAPVRCYYCGQRKISNIYPMR